MSVKGAFVWVPLLVAASAALVTACWETAAPPGPELACVHACRRDMDHCDRNACGRGCNLVLDRLVERERSQVFACVAAARSCADSTWATCATQVGNYVDGGPSPEDYAVSASP